jgi:signal transduction histidine kinase
VTTHRLLEALREARRTLQPDVGGSHLDHPAAALARQSLELAEALVDSKDGALHDRALLEQIHVLKRELRIRDEFISAVGHELRNPVSPVFLIIDRLRNALSGPSETVAVSAVLPHVENLGRRLLRFLDTLNRLLDISRLSAGRPDLVLDRVDLCEVAREVANGFEGELTASRSRLALDLQGSVVGTWDPVRLQQIIANLLSNAIRYGASKPIELSVHSSDADATLCITDHGVGVARADHERIFLRFERATGNPHRGGFGVGLWIVKELCEAMGGSITLQSVVGEGSTFTVRLPRESSGSAP